MHAIWTAVLGLLLGGYIIGEGYAFGIGILLPLLGRTDRDRRTVLAALGPYFLGNEVWLVGAAGVMVGAFPRFEGVVLSRLYPLVVLMLLGIILRDMALHLRSREKGRSWRAGWDRVFVAASVALAATWGLIIGNLVQGVPDGPGQLFNPFALLCAVTLPAVLALHAAAFLALRARTTPLAEIALDRGRRARALALPLAVLAVVAGVATAGVRSATSAPVAALAATVVMLLAFGLGAVELGRGNAGRAFALTSLGSGLPVLLAGLAVAGPLGAGVADVATLHLLDYVVLPVVPILLGYQIWLWTAFRAPVTRPAYW